MRDGLRMASPWPGRPAHRKAKIDKLCFFTSFETRLWPQFGCSIASATAAVLISDLGFCG